MQAGYAANTSCLCTRELPLGLGFADLKFSWSGFGLILLRKGNDRGKILLREQLLHDAGILICRRNLHDEIGCLYGRNARWLPKAAIGEF